MSACTVAGYDVDSTQKYLVTLNNGLVHECIVIKGDTVGSAFCTVQMFIRIPDHDIFKVQPIIIGEPLARK